jgi:hypothetical protein
LDDPVLCSFWLSFIAALHELQQRLEEREVTLTLDTLKAGGRQHRLLQFQSDTGLGIIDEVKSYSLLMKDFPLKNLLVAQDISSLEVRTLS